jgi:predicted 2-oxoglutarate/Fe(II)-dependent dioxygenase YbiX
MKSAQLTQLTQPGKSDEFFDNFVRSRPTIELILASQGTSLDALLKKGMSFETIYQNLFTYYVFDNIFTAEECQKIIDLQGDFFESTDAALTEAEAKDYVKKHYRSLTNKFVLSEPENEWILSRAMEKVNQVNNSFYKFHFEKLVGTMVAKYKENDFFDWHIDQVTHDDMSKLSFTVFLSKSAEYEGGKLKFKPDMPDFQQEQGKIVIFPSYMPHAVERVTRGTRYALVGWAK